MKSPNASARIERSLRQRLLLAYRRDLPFPPERIVVGFSGGPDSLALAILLAGIARAIPSTVELLHVDHRLRPESGDEAHRCGELAATLGVPFRSCRVPDHPQTLYPGVGIEEAARRARYEIFADVTGDRDVIVLAHHAGDQAETVLLHLMHGAGIGGLAGMRAIGPMHIPWWPDAAAEVVTRTVWRPLLAERRDELLTVIAHHGLTPLLDPSNDDTSLKRNAVRHRALPVLRQIEPSIEERLGTLASIAAEEDALLAQLSSHLLAHAKLPCGGLSARLVRDAPVALGRRVIRQWLSRDHALDPGFDRVEAALALARSQDQTARLEIGEGLLIGCFGDSLRAGPIADLQRHAWRDAALLLPLIGGTESVAIDGDTVLISSSSQRKRPCATRSLPGSGLIGLAPVRSAGDRGGWNEWLRQARISPWIRDLVQGVTVDGVLWWIPRRGDYDDAGGGRRVRIVGSDQELD